MDATRFRKEIELESPMKPAGQMRPARPVGRSRDATFALRATARPQDQGRAIAKRRRDEGGRGRRIQPGVLTPGKMSPKDHPARAARLSWISLRQRLRQLGQRMLLS